LQNGKWLSDIANDVSEKGLAKFLTDLANAIIKGAWDMGAAFIEGFMDGVTGGKADAGKELVDKVASTDLFGKAGEESGDAFIDGFEESIDEYDFKGLTDKIKTTGKGIDLFGEMITFEGGISKNEEVLMQLGQKIADEYGEDVPEDFNVAMKDAMKDENPIRFMFDWIYENMPQYKSLLSDYYAEEVEEVVKELTDANYGKVIDTVREKGMSFSEFTSEDNKIIKLLAKDLSRNSGEYSDTFETYLADNDLTVTGLEKAQEKEIIRLKELAHQKQLALSYKPSTKMVTAEGGIIEDDAVTPIGQIVDTGIDEAFNISESKMPTVGKKLVTDMTAGITSAQPDLDAKLEIIKTTVDTTFENISSNAYNWGSDFMTNLIAGITSQMSYFNTVISNINTQMASLQFPTSTPTGGNGKTNITINITGNTFDNETGMNVTDIGTMVEDKVTGALNKYNRTTVI